MKNLINNKILIILTMFAVIVGFGSNVFAFTYEYNNSSIEVPDFDSLMGDDFDLAIIFKYYYNNKIKLILAKTSSNPHCHDDGDYICTNPNIEAKVYVLNNDSWSFQQDTSMVEISSPSYLRYSNFDVCYSSGEVVFQKAPQEQVAETILAPVVEQVEMNKVTQEIVEILPVIMITLVSIIAIWKAVNYLRNVLKTS